MRWPARIPALLLVLLAVMAQRADATFHLMLIAEVYPGSHANPNAQYVVLRSTFSGQNFLSGHPIRTQDAFGTPGPNFGTFASNPANGSLGARYLMATLEAQAFFGIQADGTASGRLPFPSGRICFDSDLVDCVAYGSYTGSNGTYGLPATALVRQQALVRISDTSNNRTDFQIGAPNPANSSNQTSPDSDRDGVPNFSDCADSDSSLYLRPLEVTNLLVGLPQGAGGPTTVSWDSQSLLVGLGTVYDLLGGDVPKLGGDAPFSSAVCLQNDLNSTAPEDPRPDPPAGTLRYYLARGHNGCGTGTYGNSSVSPDPRDALDDPATTPCP